MLLTVKTDIYKYPLIHSTNKSGNRYLYTNTTKYGHFGIKKIIFGQTGIYDVIIDKNGTYGMTDNSMAIKCDKDDNMENLRIALLSDKFNNIIKACSFGNYRIDWRLFTYFKKDFWKEFV